MLPTTKASVVGFLFFLNFSAVLSQNADENGNPTGAGCVDPDGLLNCYSSNVDTYNSCVNGTPDTCAQDGLDPCFEDCANFQLAANIACWIGSCWNQVCARRLLEEMS
jgi:hypothetical protein